LCPFHATHIKYAIVFVVEDRCQKSHFAAKKKKIGDDRSFSHSHIRTPFGRCFVLKFFNFKFQTDPDSWRGRRKATSYDFQQHAGECLDSIFWKVSSVFVHIIVSSYPILHLTIIKQISAEAPSSCGPYYDHDDKETIASTIAASTTTIGTDVTKSDKR
jgi:hypothetical protein